MDSTATASGNYLAWGTNVFGDAVYGGYYSQGDFWYVWDEKTSAIYDNYFEFTFDDDNNVTGWYYQIKPKGATTLDTAYPLSGVRSSTSSTSLTIRTIDGVVTVNTFSNIQVATATGGVPPYYFFQDTLRNGSPPL